MFSMEDDYWRLISRAVSLLTTLAEINNPQKALGPVSNALSYPLVPVLLEYHHSRNRSGLIETWNRLIQPIQEVPTVESIRPMADEIFAADLEHNSKATIIFFQQTACRWDRNPYIVFGISVYLWRWANF